jgi:hypothetical protein
MAWNIQGSYSESCLCAFGIRYEGKAAFSSSKFAWTA